MDIPIKFGTDGWRAIIADTFTFENLRYAARATADYFKHVKGPEPAVFIGYDVRFLSEKFATIAAEVLAASGFRVVIMDRPYPTPYVSFEVKRRGFVGGVVITASHNPPSFNGFKVKAHFGGSATPAITAKIEANLGAHGVRPYGSEPIETVAPERPYLDHLKSLVDWESISKSGLKIVVDSMHGCGGYILEEMLRGTSCTVQTIRGNPDPLFGGIHPEPMMPQLQPLGDAVRK